MKYTRRKYLYWVNRAKRQGLQLEAAEQALRLFEQGHFQQGEELLDDVVDRLKKDAWKLIEDEFYLGLRA